jgi:hypothetical protein
MDKAFYTLYAGDKYPPETLYTLARSLEPYGVPLIVALADVPLGNNYRDVVRCPGNVVFTNIPVFHYTQELGFKPAKWWWKMVFHDLGWGDVLFVDLDTVFTKDPAPIFDWIEREKPEMAFMPDWLSDRAATPLFYLSADSDSPSQIWLSFKAMPALPARGDQDFVQHVIRARGLAYKEFPPEFMCSYKVMWPPKRIPGENWKVWKAAKERKYSHINKEDIISYTFNGHTGLADIMEKRHRGYQFFKDKLPEEDKANATEKD